MRRLRGLATGPGVGLLLTIFVLVSVAWFRFGPAVRLTSTGIPLLDSRSEYSPDQAYGQLAAYGELGRARYQVFLAGDLVWAFFFGVTVAAMLLLALRVVGRDTAPWTSILALPAVLVVLDWVENGSLFLLTARFPDRLDKLAAFVPYVTTAKLMLVNVTFLLTLGAVATVLFGLMWRARRRTA